MSENINLQVLPIAMNDYYEYEARPFILLGRTNTGKMQLIRDYMLQFEVQFQEYEEKKKKAARRKLARDKIILYCAIKKRMNTIKNELLATVLEPERMIRIARQYKLTLNEYIKAL